MQNNWMIEEACKIDSEKDVVILQDPEKRKCLDNILTNRFWPVIKESLDDTLYNYNPAEVPEIDFEFSYELTRSLTYMLFDDQRAIFRGKLSCTMSHWMLHSEFFLGLDQDTDPMAIIQILENPLMKGMPPSLIIDKDMPFDYFQITFQNGRGSDWGYNDDYYIFNKIRESIEVNAELYDFSKGGLVNRSRVKEFLYIAHKVYEAY
ncbi:MAG: hypothetical protein M1409_08520 [Actinobacteria bacterium]|nr:hypothetical protein [Actinomycetota bacterium]